MPVALRPCEVTQGHFPAIDIQRVMLHELGHVLGLAHPVRYGADSGSNVITSGAALRLKSICVPSHLTTT